MRRTALMREAGPYVVKSHSDGVLRIYPAWKGWPGKAGYLRETEEEERDGGGPGVLHRMGLADDLQRWLNAPYDDTEEDLAMMERIVKAGGQRPVFAGTEEGECLDCFRNPAHVEQHRDRDEEEKPDPDVENAPLHTPHQEASCQ